MSKQIFNLDDIVTLSPTEFDNLWNTLYDAKTQQNVRTGVAYDSDWDYIELSLQKFGTPPGMPSNVRRQYTLNSLPQTKKNLLRLLIIKGLYKDDAKYVQYFHTRVEQYNMYAILSTFDRPIQNVVVNTGFTERLFDKEYVSENPFALINNPENWIALGKAVLDGELYREICKEWGDKEGIMFKAESMEETLETMYRILSLGYCHYNSYDGNIEYLEGTQTLVIKFNTASH